MSKITAFSILLYVGIAFAGAPSVMTFQSKIIGPSGTALEAANVNFRFTILDSAGTCVLYVEDYANVNMTGTQGVVAIPLGSGTKVFPPAAVNLHEVFNNSTATFNCQAGGTSSPTATDNRQVVMQFNDGSGWQTLPQMAINAVPFANYATRAESLGAYAANAYLRPSTLPTCTAGQALNWDGTTFTCMTPSGGGSTYTGVTSIANASGDITLAPAAGTGSIRITSNAPSTSTTTGAVVITGGMGVSGAINAAGNIITSGSISSSGSILSTTSVFTPQLYGTSTALGGIKIDGTSNAAKGDVLLASAGGNVGIGTLTPSQSLHVIGNVLADRVASADSIYVTNSINSGATEKWIKIATLPPNAAANGSFLDLEVYGGQPLTSEKYKMWIRMGARTPFTAYISRLEGSTMSFTHGGVQVFDTGAGYDVFLHYKGTNNIHLAARVTRSQWGSTGVSTLYPYEPAVTATPVGSVVFDSSTAAPQTTLTIGGNLGIGTTTPAYALSVSGDVNVTGNFRVNGTVFTGGGSTQTGVTSISNASGDITLAPATGTGAVQINSGAASTSPTTGALIVSGGVGVSGGIYAGGAISSGSTISANTSMYTPQLYGTSTPSGSIRIDGTSHANRGNVLLASPGGSVAIGTTTPSFALSIGDGVGNDGSILALGYGTVGTNGMTLATTGAGTRMIWYPKKAAFRAGNVASTQWDDANIGNYSIALGADTKASAMGSIAIGNGAVASATNAIAMHAGQATGTYGVAIGNWPTASAAQGIAIGNHVTADANQQMSVGAYNMPTGTENAGSWVTTDPLFTIGNGTGTGTNRSTAVMVLKNGNVGIGTTTPSELLHIYSTTAKYGIIAGNVAAPAVGSGPYIRAEGRIYTGDGTAALPSFSFGLAGQEDNGMFRPGNDILGFSTAGSEKLRIDSTGNVGIGTTTPIANLHIEKNQNATTSAVVYNQNAGATSATSFTLGNSSDSASFLLAGTGAGRFAGVVGTGPGGIYFDAQNAAGTLNFRTGSPASQHMIIDSSGNVGIGTTTPGAKLHVEGALAVNAIYEGAATSVNSTATYTIPNTSMNIRRITLTANTTINLPTFTSPTAKVFSLTLFLKQDATGSRTVTFASAADTIKWDSNVAPTISTAPGTTTIITLIKASDETVWYASMNWKEN